MRPLRVFTWHVHGNYLWYLSQFEHELYLPVRRERGDGYWGRTPNFEWGDHVHEVDADAVRTMDFDCIVYQSHRNWLEDQFDILSPAQRRLPRVFVEHDPPRQSPTDTRHPVDDPGVLLVHVTHFNDLMWDSGRTPATVVEHGVVVPDDVRWTGDLPRGITVVNGLARRGRRLGADVFLRVRDEAGVPLDLVGMFAEEAGGKGEVPARELAAFEAHYRFFFNPIRYTSLGLAMCEAMTIGLPVLGLATTEMATAVQNGVSGYVETNVATLVEHMRRLLRDPAEARRLSEGARRTARERFAIERFVADWSRLLRDVAGRRTLAS